MAIKMREAKISCNGVVQKALFRALDKGFLAPNASLHIVLSLSCSLKIEQAKYSYVGHQTMILLNQIVRSELSEDIISSPKDGL